MNEAQEEKGTEEKPSAMAPAYETEDDKAARFEEERQQRLQQIKKENQVKEKKMKQMRDKLKQKQIAQTKKKLANNPLAVDQVTLYEQNIKRVTGKATTGSPPSTKSTSGASMSKSPTKKIKPT